MNKTLFIVLIIMSICIFIQCKEEPDKKKYNYVGFYWESAELFMERSVGFMFNRLESLLKLYFKLLGETILHSETKVSPN